MYTLILMYYTYVPYDPSIFNTRKISLVGDIHQKYFSLIGFIIQPLRVSRLALRLVIIVTVTQYLPPTLFINLLKRREP